MTLQRQERKGGRRGIAFIGLLAALSAVSVRGEVASAATTERVVANRFSGLAIDGYDPVAYFADGRPLPGLAEQELAEAGVVWRFRNEGNRASFAASPDVYAPKFGGYDPVDVARGVAFPGNPKYWLISGNRLYLFGREESRDAFAAAPARVLLEAEKSWPAVKSKLSE
jgi:hypothetical protein